MTIALTPTARVLSLVSVRRRSITPPTNKGCFVRLFSKLSKYLELNSGNKYTMVFMGPDPPSVDDLSTPNCTMPADLIEEESDDDHDPYSGYQPLPQAPESADAMLDDDDSDEDTPSNDGDNTNVNYLPPIETVEQEVIRHVWTAPRTVENIEMNLDKAQMVMSAMANFSLPASSIPDWANTLTEDHWKQQLSEKINHLNGKR